MAVAGFVDGRFGIGWRVMMGALYRRDVRLGFAAGGGTLVAFLFFLSVIVTMPFALGPDLPLLARIGPAILWIGALLSGLLGLDRLFQADREDGALDLMRSGANVPELAVMVAVKCLAHWTVTALPLVLAVPFLALILNLDGAATLFTMLALAIGTPAISFIGAAGAAAGVGLVRGGLLVAIITLPLCVPVLIFGSAAAGARDMADALTPLALLGALTLFFAVCGPLAAAWFLSQLDE
jgi:heme exporter protein B